MNAPILVTLKLKDGCEPSGNLDYTKNCQDVDMPFHRNSISRPVVLIEEEANGGDWGLYCLACWIDDDEVVEIVMSAG